MSVKLAHASISEKGTIRGEAGDQTGKEVCIRNWYKHSKGWVLMRCNDEAMRPYIAEAGKRGAENDNIGYDQIENQDLWDDVKNQGYDPGKASKPTETDCARFVRVCVQYACKKVGRDIVIPDFYTATLASNLKKTGLFTKYTASKYVDQDDLLLTGDILVTRTKGHTAIVISDGDKAHSTGSTSSGTTISNNNTSYVGKGIGQATAKQTMNVRSGAGTSYPSYCTIKKNTQVEVLEVLSNGWLKIVYTKAAEGFAYTSNKNNAYYKYTENTYEGKYVTTGNLNMRSGAGTTNKSLLVIPKGKTVTCTGEHQNVDGVEWLQVTYSGKTGYCSTRYLKKK